MSGLIATSCPISIFPPLPRRLPQRSSGGLYAARVLRLQHGGRPMTVLVYRYTIYHSPNAYLGTVLLRRALANVPGVRLIRQPIYIPHERGVLVAELLGGKENRNVASYLREDCR